MCLPCRISAGKIEEYLRKHPQFCRIGIVLSGDAGFYSGAKKLEEVLNGSEERYEIQRIPGISSVVYFAAALHTSWEDAALVSLHGRWQNWIYEAEHHAKTFLLLGGRKENLKEKLLYYGLEDLTVHIGKNFSYPQEQIFSKTVSELTEEDTEGLCIVCLENPHPSQKVCRHLKDEAFTRGNVPMTKEEVRTICIAKLDLEKMRFFMTLVREQVLLLLKQPARTAVFECMLLKRIRKGSS